jgi:hypothetical protein
LVAPLLDQVRGLRDDARGVVADADLRVVLDAARQRLDEPLRVAIAGKVKAGKSTLLNALVGEEVAPTDAGECTKIVTWYANGHRYRVMLHPLEGEPADLAFTNDDNHLQIDLGGWRVEQASRLEVTWPTRKLERMTLIDTPGMASLSVDVSARTTRFLTPDDAPSAADAVIYLMRYVHETDLRFLEAFHDDEPVTRTPINGIAVLSRADEVGNCTETSMEVAERVAARWRADDRLRRMCQTVIPVAGLLAQAGTTLREREFQLLRRLAACPAEELTALLLSADRFVGRPVAVGVPTEQRQELLGRMGLFGVRLGIGTIARGEAATSSELASRMVATSGLERLRSVLAGQFETRSQVLKSRTALATLEQLLPREDSAGARRLLSEVQRVSLGAHEVVEIGLLNRIRSGTVLLPAASAAEIERVLGGSGATATERLGLDPDAPPADVVATAEELARKYRRMAAHPLTTREMVDVAGTVQRTCEGILGEWSGP